MPAASRRWGPGERTLVSYSSTGLLPKGWVFSATAIANGQKVTEKIPKKSEKSDEERSLTKRDAPCPKRTVLVVPPNPLSAAKPTALLHLHN